MLNNNNNDGRDNSIHNRKTTKREETINTLNTHLNTSPNER